MSNPETKDFSFVVEVPFYGRVAPDLDDVIIRYRSPIYDHVRYHVGVQVQTEEGIHSFQRIRALFLGKEVLDIFAKHGVPEAYADLPTKAVAEAYQADQIDRFEAEMDTTGDEEV